MNVSAKNRDSVLYAKCTLPVKVVWQRRAFGGMTALAEENAAGYKKGETIMVIDFESNKLPTIAHVIPKNSYNEI
jgi:hypothetical protein